MRAYATEVSDTYFYLNDNQLSTAYKAGGTRLIAPGDVAWKADLDALRCLNEAQPAARWLPAVVPKYLINEQQGGDHRDNGPVTVSGNQPLCSPLSAPQMIAGRTVDAVLPGTSKRHW